jgi:hypothetical protein
MYLGRRWGLWTGLSAGDNEYIIGSRYSFEFGALVALGIFALRDIVSLVSFTFLALLLSHICLLRCLQLARMQTSEPGMIVELPKLVALPVVRTESQEREVILDDDAVFLSKRFSSSRPIRRALGIRQVSDVFVPELPKCSIE